MKKFLTWKKELTRKVAQKYADILYKKLKESLGKDEFNTWYTMALYLDYWCVSKDIYLD